VNEILRLEGDRVSVLVTNNATAAITFELYLVDIEGQWIEFLDDNDETIFINRDHIVTIRRAKRPAQESEVNAS
jgi:hypothetical protein